MVANTPNFDTLLATSEPNISLERFAQVSAELSEGREPRAKCLERHGFDNDSWAIEERSWLEKMANLAASGDSSLLIQYGHLVQTAQDGMATEQETQMTLDDYASLKVSMERMTHPATLLRDRSLTMRQWMRIDRHFRQKALSDRNLMETLEQRLKILRQTSRE